MKKSDLKTILVVDDDQDILSAITNVLEHENFNVLTACNGQEGLALLNSLQDDELPDLILLDYMMPVWNGERFNASRVQVARLAKIPVVVMTANTNLNEIMSQVRVDAYINKPMNVETILKVAHNFIIRRKLAEVSFLT